MAMLRIRYLCVGNAAENAAENGMQFVNIQRLKIPENATVEQQAFVNAAKIEDLSQDLLCRKVAFNVSESVFYNTQ